MTVTQQDETTEVVLQPNFHGMYELLLSCVPTKQVPHPEKVNLTYVRLDVRHGSSTTHSWVLIANGYANRTLNLTGMRRFKAKNSPEGLVLTQVELFEDGRWVDFVEPA